MRIATTSATSPATPPRDLMVGEPGSPVATSADPRFAQFKLIRRNGAVVAFEPAKLTIALTKAFLAVNGGQGASSARVRAVSRKARTGTRAGKAAEGAGGRRHDAARHRERRAQTAGLRAPDRAR